MAWRGPTNTPANNPAPNNINHSTEMSGMKVSENRAMNVRRDKDTEKDFSVNLIDIDGAIFTYLDTVISPTIIDSGRQVKVPISYASEERWKSIRKDGVIRDKNGKIQCPAIAYRRTTMQRNDGLITFNRYLQYPVEKKFSEKNQYDKFSAMSGFSPVKELYSVAMPDHVIINYDYIVWTDLVEQGNEIIQAINFSTEDYWGDKKRFKFRTSISDYNFETSLEAGQDRVVKTTFSMMVYAYLLPNRYENYKSVVQKAFTPRKIVFGTEASNISAAPDKAAKPDLFSVSTMDIQSPRNGTPIGISPNSNHAFVSDYSAYANSAATASYLNASGSVTYGSISISNAGATGSFNTNVALNVSASGYIDSVPISSGNAGKWLISINDGGANFKTSEMVATWNNTYIKYYNTEVSQIGSVPVFLSADNTGGNINILANPIAGNWTIKLIRMMV
jgi:hypothetical protein